MLMSSGFFTKPRPLVEFDCGSQSTSSVLTSAAASEAARLMAVVVLPTPPFWLATAMTRPMILLSFLVLRDRICPKWLWKQCLLLCRWGTCVSRETHLNFREFEKFGGWATSGDGECFTWNTFSCIVSL